MSLPTDYVIEPGQSYVFDLFRPEDAEGVARLFKTVYGGGYPINTFTNPDRLIEENKGRRTISCVARTPKGDIVGHAAIFRSAPYENNYESGAGLVHPNYRGGAGIFTRLGVTLEKIAPRFGVEAIFGEAVCNHVFAQKAMNTIGYVSHTLEVDLMPGESYEQEKSAQGRVAALLNFKTLKPSPHTVVLPGVYEEPLRFLYGGLDDERQLQISKAEQPGNVKTELISQFFDSAKVARIEVRQAGDDFSIILDQEEKKCWPEMRPFSRYG